MLDMFRQKVPIYGDFLTFRYIISAVDPSPSSDTLLAERLQAEHNPLRDEINKVVGNILGKNFTVSELAIKNGSVEVLVVISAIGVVYMGLSRYKNFIESIDLLRTHVRDIISHRADVPAPTITSTWEPSPLVVRNLNDNQSSDNNPLLLVLVAYILITHFSLFVALLYFVSGRRF
jgi:hypothetical protein